MTKVQPMRAAIYCKTVGGKSAVAQERALRRLCHQRGWAVGKVYSDQPNRSQKKTSKTARLAMTTDILSDDARYGVICVWHIGMLGHAIDDILWLLEEVSVKRRIGVVVPGDGIDTTVDGAVKVIAALAAVGRTGT